MKKFLIFCTIIFLLISGYKYSLKEKPTEYSDVNYISKVNGKDIIISNGSKFEKFKIKGINLEDVKPGEFPNENNVTKDEYLRWLNQIYEMNANTIRVKDLMPTSFYEALYEFNKEKEKPLYIVQGIRYDEVSLKEGKDIQNKDLKENFKEYSNFVIDSIHGNRFNNTNKLLFGEYKKDVSKYVIAYTIGIDWAVQDIIYTEVMNSKKPFTGEYLYTQKGASAFESFLAELGDYVIGYESKRYGSQKLITFLSSIQYLTSKENVEDNDKRYVDLNNINGTEKFKTGLFVSFNLDETYLNNLDDERDIKGILKNINSIQNKPVVIGEYGASTSRCGTYYGDKTYLTEQQQGEVIIKLYRTINEAGCSGSIINEWQDGWYKTSWNTKDFTILDRNTYWKDSTSYNQSYGILDFENGKYRCTSYLDGSLEEWTDEDIIDKSEKLSISAKSDLEYIYFMIKGENNFNINGKQIFIDLDTTPKSGSFKSSEYGLNFESGVDFIININNKNSSRVLVHEYYNPQTFIKSKTELKIRPDVIHIPNNIDKFSKMFRFLRPKTHAEKDSFINEIELETGKLIYGNSNPSDKNYNSAADFFFGENFVEVRIPYGMLNFMDPSQNKIQDDYYENFKFVPIKINNIKIGATIKEKNKKPIRLTSKEFKLKSWVKPEYHERLKKSYYMIQEEFK